MGRVRRQQKRAATGLLAYATLAAIVVGGIVLGHPGEALQRAAGRVLLSQAGQQADVGSWGLSGWGRLALRDVRLRSVSEGVFQAASLPLVELAPAVQWRKGFPVLALRVRAAGPEIVLSTSPQPVQSAGSASEASSMQAASDVARLVRKLPPVSVTLQDATLRTLEADEPILHSVELNVESRGDRLVVSQFRGEIGPARLTASGRYEALGKRWEAVWTLSNPVLGMDTVWSASGVGLRGKVTGQLAMPEMTLNAQGVVAMADRRGTFRVSLRDSDTGEDVVLTRVSASMPTWHRVVIQGEADEVNVAEQTGHGRFVVLASVIESRRELRGVFQGYDWLIGAASLPPLRGQFVMSPERLALRRVAFGRAVQFDGEMLYDEPAQVRAEVKLDRVLLAQFSGTAGVEEQSSMAGHLSGVFSIDGKLPTPWVHGTFRSTEGGFGAMRYQTAALQFDGPWPTVQFHDSAFLSPAGTPLRVQGNIDLRELGKPTVFRRVQVVTAQGATSWEGWEVEPHASNTDKLAISRSLGEAWKLGLQSYLQKEPDQQVASNDELQVRYRLTDFQNMRLGVTKDEEFMGMEHRWQF